MRRGAAAGRRRRSRRRARPPPAARSARRRARRSSSVISPWSASASFSTSRAVGAPSSWWRRMISTRLRDIAAWAGRGGGVRSAGQSSRNRPVAGSGSRRAVCSGRAGAAAPHPCDRRIGHAMRTLSSPTSTRSSRRSWRPRRSSTSPFTRTSPSWMSSRACPPVSARPASFSSWPRRIVSSRIAIVERLAQRPLSQRLVGRRAQPQQPRGDLRGGVRRERQAQRARVGIGRVERRARHERDVVAQRGREQLGRVPAVGQPRPDEHPAVGMVERRARRQRVVEAAEQRVAAAAVLGADVGDVVVEAPVCSEIRAACWSTVRRVQVGRLLGDRQRPEQRLGRAQEADPQAGGEHLRQRRDGDRAVARFWMGARRARAARRRSAARRRGRPRRPTGRARRRSARAAGAAAAGSVRPVGFWNVGTR